MLVYIAAGGVVSCRVHRRIHHECQVVSSVLQPTTGLYTTIRWGATTPTTQLCGMDMPRHYGNIIWQPKNKQEFWSNLILSIYWEIKKLLCDDSVGSYVWLAPLQHPYLRQNSYNLAANGKLLREHIGFRKINTVQTRQESYDIHRRNSYVII